MRVGRGVCLGLVLIVAAVVSDARAAEMRDGVGVVVGYARGVGFSYLHHTPEGWAVGGVALGVGFGIVYWSVAKLLEAMGGIVQLPPFLAGWSPDIIFFFLGMYFFFKMPT